MKTNLLFLIIYLYNFPSSYAQTDSIVKFIRNYELEKAENLVESLDNEGLKNAFLFEIKYMKEGINDENIIKKILEENRKKESIIENIAIAEYYNINNKDSLTFDYLKNALKNAKIKKDTLLINESTRRILFLFFKNPDIGKGTFKKYIDMLDRYKRDGIDRYWTIYFNIAIRLQRTKIKDFSSSLKLKTEEEFKIGFKQVSHPYLIGSLKNFEGIYQDVFLKNRNEAYSNYYEAIDNFYKINHFYSQSKISNVIYNLGFLLKGQGEIEKWIEVIKNDVEIKNLRDTPEKKIYQMLDYEELYKAYRELKKSDSALYYFEKMIDVKNNLNNLRHAREIARIDNEYAIDEKVEEITFLSGINKTLQKRLSMIIPFLSIFVLASFIFFFFYKRYKKRSKILEKDQSETLQKLDELKNIVIKNHIILKDKTKIYISDLMYIKSDDHYLNVFLSDSKNHFVRGKLSQIKEELPPNFIQCHRSYIVNANFIKQVNGNSLTLIDKTQIPLSRSYKDKF